MNNWKREYDLSWIPSKPKNPANPDKGPKMEHKVNGPGDKNCHRCGGNLDTIIGNFRICPACESNKNPIDSFQPLKDFVKREYDKDDAEAVDFKVVSGTFSTVNEYKDMLDALRYLSGVPFITKNMGNSISIPRLADKINKLDPNQDIDDTIYNDSKPSDPDWPY